MRDLMRDHVIHHVTRREDEAPGEGEHAVGRAASPPALGVAQDDALHVLAELLGLGSRARFDLAPRFQLQPVGDPARDMLLMPGDVDLLLFAPHHPARMGAMADAMGDAEERNHGAMREGHGLRQLIQSFFDPLAILQYESLTLMTR